MWRSEGKGESEGDSGGGLCETVHKTAQPQTPHIFFCVVIFRSRLCLATSLKQKPTFT